MIATARWASRHSLIRGSAATPDRPRMPAASASSSAAASSRATSGSPVPTSISATPSRPIT
ncbi:hypothetical protein [Streptomyces aidingensis]|uniref:hypothetical protein n=1 Tax=Streptomyces aidingensis TaxID=910347 RepID=UPI001C312067|nr:hypothetical protein [Streptomyces aidingensis]